MGRLCNLVGGLGQAIEDLPSEMVTDDLFNLTLVLQFVAGEVEQEETPGLRLWISDIESFLAHLKALAAEKQNDRLYQLFLELEGCTADLGQEEKNLLEQCLRQALAEC